MGGWAGSGIDGLGSGIDGLGTRELFDAVVCGDGCTSINLLKIKLHSKWVHFMVYKLYLS